MFGEIKTVTARIPSGAATSSGVHVGGFRRLALLVPTLTSAALAFLGPTGGAGWALFRTTAGTQVSAAPPGGITAMWLGADQLGFLAGFAGEVRISAAANQAADRDFVWHLKG